MKTQNPDSSTGSPTQNPVKDSAKLVSLLALAAGAAAMPQTANANVIVTKLSTPQQVDLSGNTFYGFTLIPGVSFGFEAVASTQTRFSGLQLTHFRSVLFGMVSGTGANVGVQANGSNAVPQAYGASWNTSSPLANTVRVGSMITVTTIASSKYYYGGPSSYSDHMYLGFKFNDAGQPRYGWAEVFLQNPTSVGPVLTLYGYAYDDQGNPLPMGVPEPAPLSILALGAMALGAKGVRAWRRNRPATTRP